MLMRRTVSELLFWGTENLVMHDSPRLEAEVLLASFLDVDRAYLKIHEQEIVSLPERLKFFYGVYLRSKHTPLSYIRGWKDWCGFRIRVTPSVLIPRDETEVLMQHIFATEKNPQSILDVGTGSGCIALALAKKYPTARVLAFDASKPALEVAQKNFQCFNASVVTKQSDLLSALPCGAVCDLIVANLPYIPVNLPLSKSVQKEPSEALLSGTDGLDLLKRLAKELQEKEIRFQSLWLEFLPQQWEEIQNIFKFWHVKSYTDVSGNIYFARITSR